MSKYDIWICALSDSTMERHGEACGTHSHLSLGSLCNSSEFKEKTWEGGRFLAGCDSLSCHTIAVYHPFVTYSIVRYTEGHVSKRVWSTKICPLCGVWHRPCMRFHMRYSNELNIGL